MAASQQLFYCIRPQLDRMLGEGILMLVRMMKFSLDSCFAATILLYLAPTRQDTIGEGILMLISMMKFSLDGCFAATILLYPAPTGQDARGGDPNASTYDEVQP